MKKLIVLVLALAAITIQSCDTNKTKLTEEQTDTAVVASDIVLTPEDAIARAEAEMMTDELAEKLSIGDVASATDIINQAEAAIKQRQAEGDMSVAAFAAQIKTFLKDNKKKLDELSISTTNINLTVNQVEGVDEAVAMAEAALKAAEAKGMDVLEAAKNKSTEAESAAKTKSSEAVNVTKETTPAASSAAKSQPSSVSANVQSAGENAAQEVMDEVVGEIHTVSDAKVEEVKTHATEAVEAGKTQVSEKVEEAKAKATEKVVEKIDEAK